MYMIKKNLVKYKNYKNKIINNVNLLYFKMMKLMIKKMIKNKVENMNMIFLVMMKNKMMIYKIYKI
jgi:hypothetical protein